jgi:hypothetical protein
MNNSASTNDGGFGISEEEKAQLMAEIDKIQNNG